MTSRFTFLLPAYKKTFLKDSLESILSQKYPDFSVIVSDDCSPENLLSVVEGFSDERISYRRNEHNIGGYNLVRHWNLLLQECDSDYLIIASDDDIYSPDFLNEINRIIEKYPDVDLLRVRADRIDESGEETYEEKELEEYVLCEEFINQLLEPDSVLCMGKYVFKTIALKRKGGFVFFPLAWKADSATQIMMAENGVASVNKVLFSFRMSGINISSNSGKNRDCDEWKLESIFRFDEWLDNHLREMSIDDAESIRSRYRKKLEGEMRTYYWVLSVRDFLKTYKDMVRNNWFQTIRNRVSFFVNRFLL